MKFICTPAICLVIISTILLGACKSSDKPLWDCASACLSDSLVFSSNTVYVKITGKDCTADTVYWGNDQTKRSIAFIEIAGRKMKLNNKIANVFLQDPGAVWLMYNDCETGRGYYTRLPFERAEPIQPTNKAINSLDPKYAIAANLAVYSDKGNLHIIDMINGKKGLLTFGKQLDLSFDDLHATLDSVNITATKAWAKVKIDGKWEELTKDLVLK